MLTRWHYIALLAPIALLVVEWRRARSGVILLIFTGVIFAATEVAIDLQIRSIRNASPVPISSLSRRDPLRRKFGLLHGVSSLLLIAQVMIGAAATVAIERDSPVILRARLREQRAIDDHGREDEREVEQGKLVEPPCRLCPLGRAHDA